MNAITHTNLLLEFQFDIFVPLADSIAVVVHGAGHTFLHCDVFPVWLSVDLNLDRRQEMR